VSPLLYPFINLHYNPNSHFKSASTWCEKSF
jgi:hypothetical protein